MRVANVTLTRPDGGSGFIIFQEGMGGVTRIELSFKPDGVYVDHANTLFFYPIHRVVQVSCDNRDAK